RRHTRSKRDWSSDGCSSDLWVIDASTEGSALTYSTVPSRSREFIDYGLLPYLSCIEARLSMDDITPRGTWAEFDTSKLLRASFRSEERRVGKESRGGAGSDV